MATNSNAALEQLTTATTNQYAEIKAALYRLTSATPTGAATLATVSNRSALPLTEKQPYEKRIQLLQSAIRNKWVPKTGFFSIHEWGVGPVHTSSECKEKKYEGKSGGHINAANQDNPVGPGRSINKRWD